LFANILPYYPCLLLASYCSFLTFILPYSLSALSQHLLITSSASNSDSQNDSATKRDGLSVLGGLSQNICTGGAGKVAKTDLQASETATLCNFRNEKNGRRVTVVADFWVNPPKTDKTSGSEDT